MTDTFAGLAPLSALPDAPPLNGDRPPSFIAALTLTVRLTDQGFLLKAQSADFKIRPTSITGRDLVVEVESRVSFQLSILKILAGQPDGRCTLEVVKQHLAIFYTSGPEWAARVKQLAEFAPNLDLFGQNLVAREQGTWILTDEGRAFLAALERRAAINSEAAGDDRSATDPPKPSAPLRSSPQRLFEHGQRRRKTRSRSPNKRSA